MTSIWTPGSGTAEEVNAKETLVNQEFTITDPTSLTFTLTNFSYVVNTGSLRVYVNGFRQRPGNDFIETSSTSFTLVDNENLLEAGDIVSVDGFVGITADLLDTSPLAANLVASTGSALVGFKAAGAGAVSRTVQSKLRDMINPADYGAVGDGTTNDTAAFTLLEAATTDRLINLQGLTYKVTTVPTKNRYVNGYFNVAKSVNVNGTPYSYTWKQKVDGVAAGSDVFSLLRDARDALTALTVIPIQVLGLQAHVHDQVNGALYTLHVNGTNSFISKYVVSNTVSGVKGLAANGVSNANTQLGNKGLAVEQIDDGTVKLWSSVRYDGTNFPAGNRQVVRFNYAGNAADLTNVTTYTLFDASFTYTSHYVFVKISADQRFLIAVGRTDANTYWVRVFDLAMLVAGGGGDYSSSYLYQWQIDSAIIGDDAGAVSKPVESIACDGNIIAIIAGNTTTNKKSLHIYTIPGVKLSSEDNITIGRTSALADGTGAYYETTDISIYKSAKETIHFSVMVMSGNSGARVNRIWQLGNIATAGRYTPTLSAASNIAANTLFSSHYVRIDNEVLVYTRLLITAAATGVVSFELSLPIPASLPTAFDLEGNIACSNTAVNGTIDGSTANGTASVTFVAIDTSSHNYDGSFIYTLQ